MDIQQLKPSKILLLGELCVDTYLFGHVDRISPEAPVPVLNRSRETSLEGMGGNVRNNLESLGNTVHFITNNETIEKIRVVDEKHNHQLLRMDKEHPLQPYDFELLPDVKDYDGLVISDYDKGFLPYPIIYAIVQEANLNAIPVFLDTKKTYLSGITKCFLKLNADEYAALSGYPHGNHTIVTHGSEGAMYDGITYPAGEVHLADPTGAGDTFLAAFVSAYLSCNDVPESIEFANLCASISVTKLGCHAVTKEEIHERS